MFISSVVSRAGNRHMETIMERNHGEEMDRECPERKLDFHAPLLSTRRPGRIIVPREKWDTDSSSGFIDRVPFSWEQSPGKPKEVLMRNNMAFILPLKPPPILLHPHPRITEVSSSKEEEEDDDDDEVYNDDDDDYDEGGCDGDIDNYEDGDFFSGGLDLFSLAESSDDDGMATKKSRRKAERAAAAGCRRRAPSTPSYMMERFLPAAVALAIASSQYSKEEPGMGSHGVGIGGYESDAPAAEACTPRTSRIVEGKRELPSVSSSPLAFKSCGFEILLPWRVKPKKKPKKSSVRGPFRFGCSDWKHQPSPRPK